ncbi:hypothetical protein BN137_1319 [Cronobacter condimenti 1330]|uniref:Uncharacterized protein n=1 Tax=Cronobacter condimenti 1330 TaxID=1073999 RepID=K7ZZ79_9ENTR|nr:hypothetical protein BN137_1319 [Cronobacter condimenti 1330]
MLLVLSEAAAKGLLSGAGCTGCDCAATGAGAGASGVTWLFGGWLAHPASKTHVMNNSDLFIPGPCCVINTMFHFYTRKSSSKLPTINISDKLFFLIYPRSSRQFILI